MEIENIIPHPVAKAIHFWACLSGLTIGALVFLISLFSLNLYISDLGKVRGWCDETKACVARPTMFGASVLKVYQERQSEAYKLLETLSFGTQVPTWARFRDFELEVVPSPSNKGMNAASKAAKRRALK